MAGKPGILKVLIAALPVVLPPVHAAEQPVRYIDAHSHLLPLDAEADEEIALFRKAGVASVIIMAPQPEDLQAIVKRHPGYVMPFLSVSRTPATPGVNFDINTAATMKQLLDAGAICGLGELPTRTVPPMDPSDAAALLHANRLKIYELAAARRVPVNMHVDLASPDIITAFGRVAGEYPRMPLILAHAGWGAGPDVIGKLLAVHSNLHIDLSIRLDPLHGWGSPPVAPENGANPLSILTAQGTLQPAWRSLIERYPDRFMFAIDVSSVGTNTRKQHLGELVQIARKAFGQLPRKTHEAIGHGNIERLVQNCSAGFE